MRKRSGGGGLFHLQCGIWHWITFWGWDAEHEQNKFIWKELLCPESSPIVRRVKLCIYMQCGGLARLLSELQALSWLDFNMTDSHQVQTQMGDVGILPREDWNSSWHSESCTGDGHFTEMWVKSAVAQREGVDNVEETLSPSENILAHPEKRCLLQAGSTWSCLAISSALMEKLKQLEIWYSLPTSKFEWSSMLLQGIPGAATCPLWRAHFNIPWNAGAHHVFLELYTNQLLKWMFRVDLITALKDWALEWYSVQMDQEFFFHSIIPFCLQCEPFFSHIQQVVAPGFGLPLLLCFGLVFYVPMEGKSKQTSLRWNRDSSDSSFFKTITPACRLVRKMASSVVLSQKKRKNIAN